MATNLNGKRILITAGPTWVPIDTVRVISNTASGKTGILLAKALAKLDAKVTLLLGPVGSYHIDKNIKVIDFNFFEELNSLIKSELRSKRYDIVIHSAAVSDYTPLSKVRKKISSNAKILSLTLKQTPKIINSLRKLSPGSFLVGFKFEPQAVKSILIKEARSLIRRAKLNIAVANSARKDKYAAYLVDLNKAHGPFSTKDALVKGLTGLLEK